MTNKYVTTWEEMCGGCKDLEEKPGLCTHDTLGGKKYMPLHAICPRVKRMQVLERVEPFTDSDGCKMLIGPINGPVYRVKKEGVE